MMSRRSRVKVLGGQRWSSEWGSLEFRERSKSYHSEYVGNDPMAVGACVTCPARRFIMPLIRHAADPLVCLMLQWVSWGIAREGSGP